MIVFENPGEIDIRSISTFGVSVKEGSNPIGFFGTGLKYAIAVLLRTGHKVTVMSGETLVSFDVEPSNVRDVSFDFVTMKVGDAPAAPIGFTTELGKQWELWMAYREIACNCKDEGGDGRHESYMVDPVKGKTQIIVQGDEFEGVFANSSRYILEDAPLFKSGTLEVRNRPSDAFYYRGVRVMDTKESLFTYNEQSKMDLTEDRTIKNSWDVGVRIVRGILTSTDKQVIRSVILAPKEKLEFGLDFHGWGVTPSSEFIEVVGQCVADRGVRVNQTALKVWKDATSLPFAPKEIVLTAVQQKSMARALQFCARIGFEIEGAYPVKVVESLGEGVLGLAEDRTIYIAERVFHLGGTKQLASALIEEYLHLRHGWADLTRELQSFLFEKLVSVGEELVGEPL